MCQLFHIHKNLPLSLEILNNIRRKLPELPSKVCREKRPMISVHGYTAIPPKATADCAWSCGGKWKVVRLLGRSAWKRIQGRPGLNDLTKPEWDCSGAQLRLAATEQ